MNNTVYIILSIILFAIIIILFKYNKLVKLYNRVRQSKSDIEIYLNKRFDLIPNLVECVKSYSKYEDETLEKIVTLRNNYNENNNMNVDDLNHMDNKLNKYLAVVENYPDLKANTEYLNLQQELKEVEEQLVRARNMYNHVATNYNIAREIVPNNIVAGIFGFKKFELFQLEEEKRENNNIKL